MQQNRHPVFRLSSLPGPPPVMISSRNKGASVCIRVKARFAIKPQTADVRPTYVTARPSYEEKTNVEHELFCTPSRGVWRRSRLLDGVHAPTGVIDVSSGSDHVMFHVRTPGTRRRYHCIYIIKEFMSVQWMQSSYIQLRRWSTPDILPTIERNKTVRVIAIASAVHPSGCRVCAG